MNELKIVDGKDGVEFLNVRQLSAFLSVSSDTIYGWTMRKEIPHFKVGNMLRFNKAEVIRWMQSKRVEPSV